MGNNTYAGSAGGRFPVGWIPDSQAPPHIIRTGTDSPTVAASAEPGSILISSSVTGIACLERYDWFDWASDSLMGAWWYWPDLDGEDPVGAENTAITAEDIRQAWKHIMEAD